MVTVMLFGQMIFEVKAEENDYYDVSIKAGVIIENAKATIDGQVMIVERIVKPDGSTTVTTTSGSESYTKEGKLNYNALLDRIEKEQQMASALTSTRADIAHGPNCYHRVLNTNTITVTKKDGAVSAAAMAAILATAFVADPRIIAKVAGFAYNHIMRQDIAYQVVTEQVNEVFFVADNVYYTHCYHDSIKCYDAYDHLVDTYTQQYQAVGG